MTFHNDSDTGYRERVKTMSLPFASSEIESAGIRVTRAEFSRLMGCSKQAVTDWVKAGRITVGADGRFDPRQAVRSLLATGDPAKIRARVLAPLVAEMTSLHNKRVMLELQLAEAKEAAAFHEGAGDELCAINTALVDTIIADWPILRAADPGRAVAAIRRWADLAAELGGDPGFPIATYLDGVTVSMCAEGEKEGEGNAANA
jgi:hypothetical protein